MGQETTITDGEGVSVNQVEWQMDGDPTDISGTGSINVNPSALLAGAGLTSGYLNVQDGAGWVVQNLPINSQMGSSFATMFNLGTPDGTSDSGSGVNLSVNISPTPVTSFSPNTATHYGSSLQVSDEDQGEGAAVGNPAAPSANAVSFTVGGLAGLAYEAGHANVQAADNQCGPAALANELDWLHSNYGLKIPDANVPGRGDPSTGNLYVPNGTNKEAMGNSLVGQLDLTINRASASRISGSRTSGQQQITGLMSYLGSARVGDASAVSITFQGNIIGSTGAGAGTITQSGMTATGAGSSVTPSYIFNALMNGETVKLGETSHAVDVIGAGYVLGVPWVLLSSDLAQTDVDANDSMLGNSPVFAWLVNGTLYGDDGASAVNDIVMQVVPEPTFFGLLGFGAFVLAAYRFRRAKPGHTLVG